MMVIIIDNTCSRKDFVKSVLAADDYSVIEAWSPEEAVNAVRKGAGVGLAVLCLCTPGLDGPAVIRSIRDAEGYAKAPILLLVNEAGDEEQLAWKGAGATAWVSGPLTAEKLLNAVRTLFA